jgi:adenosylhomocysteine nucleosidase
MRIGIIAALPGELTPLVRGWAKTGKDNWTGTIGEHSCMAVAGGMGAASANRAVDRVRAEFDPDVLVSYGWAGALTCGLKPGMACSISEVVDSQSGKRFETGDPAGARLLTLNYVARGKEKRKMAERYQSPLADMEAAAVARMAQQQKLGFYAFKAVSDGYEDTMPDFGRFISWEGQLQMGKFLSYVAIRPWYWASLLKLATQSKTAAVALAALARESLAKIYNQTSDHGDYLRSEG